MNLALDRMKSHLILLSVLLIVPANGSEINCTLNKWTIQSFYDNFDRFRNEIGYDPTDPKVPVQYYLSTVIEMACFYDPIELELGTNVLQ